MTHQSDLASTDKSFPGFCEAVESFFGDVSDKNLPATGIAATVPVPVPVPGLGLGLVPG